MSAGKALLVEDETLVAMIAEDILLAAGYEPVVVADRAADALTALREGGFSLAVVDIGLPDMRGDELTKRIRQDYPEVLVVVASGYDESELRARFDGDLGVAFLAKPYTERDLRAAVATLGSAG